MAKEKLTADLLAGIDDTKDITIKLGGKDYTVTIRPLTVGERSKVEAMAQRGMRVRGNAQGPTAEMEDVMLSQSSANVMTVALGMIDPDLSVSKIEKSVLPVVEIADAIKKLSGMLTSDDAEDVEPDKVHAEGAEFPED